MKILFDQGTPAPLRNWLGKHKVATAFEMGWDTLNNGDLIRSAESEMAIATSLRPSTEQA